MLVKLNGSASTTIIIGPIIIHPLHQLIIVGVYFISTEHHKHIFNLVRDLIIFTIWLT